MYDRPEISADWDVLYQNIRSELRNRGIEAPTSLDRTTTEMGAWTSDGLILSQTCGRPYRLDLHDKVQLVATPDHGLDDCDPGYYYSVVVTRTGDATDVSDYAYKRFAFNGHNSQSGWSAPQCLAQSLGFTFENTVESGGHQSSAMMVADGQADIAALDIVSWKLMQRYDGFSSNLQVIAKTLTSPALPFITSKGTDRVALKSAIDAGIAALDSATQDRLMLKGTVPIPSAEYLAVPNPE